MKSAEVANAQIAAMRLLLKFEIENMVLVPLGVLLSLRAVLGEMPDTLHTPCQFELYNENNSLYAGDQFLL